MMMYIFVLVPGMFKSGCIKSLILLSQIWPIHIRYKHFLTLVHNQSILMNKGTAVANVYLAESAYLSERVMGSNHNQNMM